MSHTRENYNNQGVKRFFFQHNFCVEPFVPREPRRNPSNRRLNERGIYIRHCQESNSQPVPSQLGADPTRPQWQIRETATDFAMSCVRLGRMCRKAGMLKEHDAQIEATWESKVNLLSKIMPTVLILLEMGRGWKRRGWISANQVAFVRSQIFPSCRKFLRRSWLDNSCHTWWNLIYFPGYRSHHSTETLLIHLLSDLHTSIDNGEVTILALLDVSAVFDYVDHNILIRRLRASFGINRRALDWLESFVRGRNQPVQIGSLRSEWHVIGTGVPQGSVLGPLLYVLFTADVLEVAGRAGAGVQQYADDTQAYQHCKASEVMHTLTELLNTIAKIKDWMSSNRLKLNPSKTQYIWIFNKIQLAKIDRQALLQRFPGIVSKQASSTWVLSSTRSWR